MTAKALVLFAGFGGVDIALREAGYSVTGIELDNQIAEVNRINGGHCLTANILDVNPTDYAGYDLLHASPPCPNFSIAKVGASETKLDIALAQKVCNFICIIKPRYFTLENVYGYRKSESYKLIRQTLKELSYGVGAWHLNAADYGVPQTRKRLILIARRDRIDPQKPWQTHAKIPDIFTHPWTGWYESIEDLISDLPESQFAPWQIARLPKDFILGNGTYSRPLDADCPSQTITSNSNQMGVRAFICNDGDNKNPFIINGQNSSTARLHQESEPLFTVVANCKKGGAPRACIGGRVVSMTPRCLARFQSFPDWFTLPNSRALACKGIGNAVPPLLYSAIIRSFE